MEPLHATTLRTLASDQPWETGGKSRAVDGSTSGSSESNLRPSVSWYYRARLSQMHRLARISTEEQYKQTNSSGFTDPACVQKLIQSSNGFVPTRGVICLSLHSLSEGGRRCLSPLRFNNSSSKVLQADSEIQHCQSWTAIILRTHKIRGRDRLCNALFTANSLAREQSSSRTWLWIRYGCRHKKTSPAASINTKITIQKWVLSATAYRSDIRCTQVDSSPSPQVWPMPTALTF